VTGYKETIRVIGFDLDQTLYPKSPEIDSAIQQYIYLKIAEYKKYSLDEAELAFKNLYKNGSGLSGSKSLMALGIPGAQDIIQNALERAPIAQFLKPNKETARLIEMAKKIYEGVDLITSSNTKNMEQKLRKLAISPDIFSHVLTADHGSKSDTSIYTKWFLYYKHLKPEQFLYIGDRPFSDYEIPNKMGIKTILIYVTAPDPNIDCPQLSSFEEIASYIL
jgi:FMN phosphatase YigB (HAD superfamily)